MSGIILTEGQQVVVRGINDETASAGRFLGVNEYGQAIVEVTVNHHHNGQITSTDTYLTHHALSAVYPVEVA